MSWVTMLDTDSITIGIQSDLFLQDVKGEVACFLLRDEDTIAAIRRRDPRIFTALEKALDEIEEISIVMNFDECHGDYPEWMLHGVDDAERKAHIVLESRYADQEIRKEAHRCLEWAAQTRAKIASKNAKKSAMRRRRSDFQIEYDRLMLALIDRDGYRCAECGTHDDITIDHVVPLSRGGSDELDNLRLLCRSCNARKGDRL